MSSRKRARRSTRASGRADLAFETSSLRLFGVALVCAYVALVPVVFDPAADWPFVVPKALLSHAIVYVLIAVMAGLLIRFGKDSFVWSWLHLPVTAFLIVNVIAAVLAEDLSLALFGTHTRMLGLGTIASWTGLYFAVTMLIRTRADLVAIAFAGLGGAAVMLLYEVIQLRGWDPFRWSTDSAVRPFSTNGQPTTLAAYFSVLAVACFATGLGAQELGRWARLLLFASAGALVTGAAATATRSPLVGLASGSAIAVALVWLRHPSRRIRNVSVLAAGATTVAVAAVLALSPVGARLLQSGGALDAGDTDGVQLDLASLDVRAVLYQVAIDAVRERPLFGYGPDSFVIAMTRHRPEVGLDEARLTYATSPHSWIAQVATGSGLIGLAAFIWIIVIALVLTVRSSFRAITAAAAAALAAYLATGLTTVNDVGSDWVFWVAAGFIASSTSKFAASPDVSAVSRRDGLDPAPGPWRRSRLLPAAFLAIGIGLALSTAQAMAASHAAGQSRDSRLARRVSQAVDFGLAATSADPGRAQYWHALGLAYVGSARWREASMAFDRAVRLTPWDTRYISDLIQTQLILAGDGDDVARARAATLADDAVLRDPNYPAAHYTRAVVMQFVGNVAEGLRAIERAMELTPRPTSVQWHVVATQLYISAGKTEEAVQAAQRGLLIVESPQIRIELARALLIRGQPQEALAQIDKVLAVEPGNATAQRLRVEILTAIRS